MIIEVLFLLTVVPVAIAGLFIGLACVFETIGEHIMIPIIEYKLQRTLKRIEEGYYEK